MKTYTVTLVRDFTTVESHEPLFRVAHLIKDSEHTAEILLIRDLFKQGRDSEAQRRKRKLPALAFSADFNDNYRKLENIRNYPGRIVLDIDNIPIDQLEKVMAIIVTIKYTLMAFVSVSGMGIKVIVMVDSSLDQHKQVFRQIARYYEKETGVKVDMSGIDPARLCFLSHDPNVYLNMNSELFPLSEIIIDTDSSVLLQKGEEIQACISKVEKKGLTANNSGNKFVYEIACNTNRMGIENQHVVGYLVNKFPDHKKVIEDTVEKTYKNNHEEFGKAIPKGKKNEAPVRERAKVCLETFEFRKNVVTGFHDFREKGSAEWLKRNSYNHNSIFSRVVKEVPGYRHSDLDLLLDSDFSTLYDPFKEYFESLPSWDGSDYISELVNTVTTTNQELFQKCITRWLLAVVSSLLESDFVNHYVLVLAGAQGIGKTSWLRKLVPDKLNEYSQEGTINPNDKDSLIALSECMLINLDELENLNRSEAGAIKQYITRNKVRIRKPYARYVEELERRASFMGSVNNKEILNDPTGSRRYLCFEATAIDYNHKINIDQVFAQVHHLYQSGESPILTPEERKQMEENNTEFEFRSVEEELILKYCTPKEEKDSTARRMNVTDIMNEFSKSFGLKMDDYSKKKMGMVLKKHGFKKVKTDLGNWGYLLWFTQPPERFPQQF